jgi:hypothetical protein
MAMPIHVTINGVWVAESGEYSVGTVIIMSPKQVTTKQLEFIAGLPESERFAYAADVVNDVDLTPWEVQYAGG